MKAYKKSLKSQMSMYRSNLSKVKPAKTDFDIKNSTF